MYDILMASVALVCDTYEDLPMCKRTAQITSI